MSRGKYSPICPKNGDYDFKFNCYGKEPEIRLDDEPFDEKRHFANYDDEGFDRYGYSSFDSDGNYVGIGNGIDRQGYTELDYLQMDDEEFDSLRYY